MSLATPNSLAQDRTLPNLRKAPKCLITDPVASFGAATQLSHLPWPSATNDTSAASISSATTSCCTSTTTATNSSIATCSTRAVCPSTTTPSIWKRNLGSWSGGVRARSSPQYWNGTVFSFIVSEEGRSSGQRDAKGGTLCPMSYVTLTSLYIYITLCNYDHFFNSCCCKSSRNRLWKIPQATLDCHRVAGWIAFDMDRSRVMTPAVTSEEVLYGYESKPSDPNATLK